MMSRGCNPLPVVPSDPVSAFVIGLLGSGDRDQESMPAEDPESEEEPDLVYESSSPSFSQPAETRVSPILRAAYLDLPVPVGLEEKVQLWEAVYSECDSNQVVLYHRGHPGIIFQIVPDTAEARQRGVERIRRRLSTLHLIVTGSDDPVAEIQTDPNSPELLELYRKFSRVTDDPDRFARAAESIGMRRGRRNELAWAYQRAIPYLPAMERIFLSQGLPAGLTRLVFVESMFDRNAVSSKGAAGVWQFLPSTANRYLTITPALDERRDPVASTRAAARFLKENYVRFGSWPLAVTAYNAGPGLLQAAMRSTGSRHLAGILSRNEHDEIGFAVENYYAQLVAVIRAEKKLGLYERQKKFNLNPLDYDLVPLPAAYNINTLAQRLGMNQGLLIALNPGWTPAVETGQLLIPKGYLLRVPKDSEAIVRSALNLPTLASSIE